MQRLLNTKLTTSNAKVAQTVGARAFSAGPKANPFDSVKTSLGQSQFYKLPSLNDQRLGKLLARSPNSLAALLNQSLARVRS